MIERTVSKVYGESISSVFRLYMACLLLFFSLLSFYSINFPDRLSVFTQLTYLPFDLNFWWGSISIIGAGCLTFNSLVAKWRLGNFLGYFAAIISFSFLSVEWLTRKPPVYAGGIITITTIIFLLGGLRYGTREADN